MGNPKDNHSNPANMNDSINNHDEPDKMDGLIDSHEVDGYNINSASTSFILASPITDLDSVSINSSTTNETAYRAISQTYSETSSQLESLKRTSTVWDSFSEVTNEKKEKKAQCNYCNRQLSHKKGSGTSHLRRHLDACLKYQRFLYNAGSKPNSSNGQTQLKFNTQSKKRIYTKETTRNDIADMVVLDELSFQFVEGRGFRRLINGLLPDFSISADTIKRDIMKSYNRRKTLIKEILQNAEGKISLTCDAWTSLQQLGYLSVTAHFLDTH